MSEAFLRSIVNYNDFIHRLTTSYFAGPAEQILKWGWGGGGGGLKRARKRELPRGTGSMPPGKC